MSPKTFLRQRRVAQDTFVRVGDDEAFEPRARILVPLARWVRDHASLLAEAEAVGVEWPCDRLPNDVPAIPAIALVCIQLPRFTDGRAYSIARLLRERHGFTGELRATGHVLRDQLRYLERCGFDAFELAEGQPAGSALTAFEEHSKTYQAAADTPLPHYRRRWPIPG